MKPLNERILMFLQDGKGYTTSAIAGALELKSDEVAETLCTLEEIALVKQNFVNGRYCWVRVPSHASKEPVTAKEKGEAEKKIHGGARRLSEEEKTRRIEALKKELLIKPCTTYELSKLCDIPLSTTDKVLNKDPLFERLSKDPSFWALAQNTEEKNEANEDVQDISLEHSMKPYSSQEPARLRFGVFDDGIISIRQGLLVINMTSDEFKRLVSFVCRDDIKQIGAQS